MPRAISDDVVRERFREVRSRLDLTQMELADMLGVASSLASQWETGARTLHVRTVWSLIGIAFSRRRIDLAHYLADLLD